MVNGGLGLLIASVLAPGVAIADPQALNTNVPVQIEDAVPVSLGTLTLQNDTRLTRDPHGRGSTSVVTSPVLKFGVLPGLHIDLGPSYEFGDKGGAGSGSGSVAALYQFNKDGPYWPALAVHGFYDTPFGAGHKSALYTLRGMATKNLGDEKAPRLHLNLSLYHLTQPDGTQRRDQLEIAVGVSALLRPDTAIVVDVVHGAKPEKRLNQTLVDVGLRHELGGGWAVSGGAGVGVAQSSPGFRVFFAVQRDFKLF